MPALPRVDVNLIVYNNAATIAATLDCVLGQTWPALAVTVIDNGSHDATLEVVAQYTSHPSVSVMRNRANAGQVANVQRGFWYGDADFVLLKTGDDLIAPDYIERLMAVLLAQSDCAMCHAAGLVLSDNGQVEYHYPPEHWLEAVGSDPVQRARHVMQRYTTAPSFWGVYRRQAVDRLSMMRYRAGFDHVVLAELALHGEIRHVPLPLFFRRGSGQPVLRLARVTTEQGNRGLPVDDVLGDQSWRTPLITTAYAHIEAFAEAPLPLAQRQELLRLVPEVFRHRWLPLMRGEIAQLRRDLPALLQALAAAPPVAAGHLARSLTATLLGARAILPEEDLTEALLDVAAVSALDRE